MNYWHDRCRSGESKIINRETGLMNYQHARCTLCGRKMLTKTSFMNYWHDRCMSGESKMFEAATDWMVIDMTDACHVRVKCSK